MDAAAEVLSHLDDAAVVDVLAGMDVDVLVEIVERMEPDDATDIIEILPEAQRSALMSAMRGGDRSHESAVWPSDSAGSIMSPSVFKMPESAVCRQAIRGSGAFQRIRLNFLRVLGRWQQSTGWCSVMSAVGTPPNTLVSL